MTMIGDLFGTEEGYRLYGKLLWYDPGPDYPVKGWEAFGNNNVEGIVYYGFRVDRLWS